MRLTIPRRVRPVIYGMLALLSVLLCLRMSPGFARVPVPNQLPGYGVTIVPHIQPPSIAQNPAASPATAAEQLEQRARNQYAARQFQAAAQSFQQAAQQYETQGNRLRQAINLSNVSLSQQQLGNWEAAEEAITASLKLLDEALKRGDTPALQSAYAQALDICAQLKLVRGKAAQSVALWERAATLHTSLGQLEAATDSQINQARALQSLGLYSRAIVVLQAVLTSPTETTLLLQDLANLPDPQQVQVQLQQRLNKLPTSASTIAVLQSLSEALQVVGNLKQADIIARHSLKLAEDLALLNRVPAIQLSLGNIVRTEAIADLRVKNMSVEQAVEQLRTPLSPVQRRLHYRRIEAAQAFFDATGKALDYYRQASSSFSPDIIQVQAHLNRLNLLLDREQISEAVAVVAQIDPLLNPLPPNRKTIEARINYAHSLRRLAKSTDPVGNTGQSVDYQLRAAQLLATELKQAIDLGDPQLESYAAGSLGEMYTETQQWAEAENLTRQALKQVNSVSVTNLPQNVNDADLAYRWQYQLGRILEQQNDRKEAIGAYKTAAQILKQRLSLDVASSNLNYQFSFNRDAQLPVHIAWMDLLLKSENPSQAELKQVREISTSLLDAQLTSFLQEPCGVPLPEEVDKIVEKSAQKTAILYPVVLSNRLEVIVKLPGSPDLYRYPPQFMRSEVLWEKVNNLQSALEEDYTFEAIQTLSKQFYDWLVKPIEDQLKQQQVDTLVFALDRRLQSIPMSVLYDGEQYLIQKYAVAEILGLKFDSSDRSVPPEELRVMAAGLSTAPTVTSVAGENIQGLFLPLDYVKEELKIIQSSGIKSKVLSDKDFTLSNFNTELNAQKFPMVHLATHGQFSVDPKRTFLLTNESNPVDVDQLAALFRLRGQIKLDAIELLIINACETASGDNLATLGIAGAAVRAGARSAIASLWTLDDAPNVKFTETLYANLKQPGTSKAEALRRAQLALLEQEQYKHPRYWSPYILAGNWLPLTTSRSTNGAGSRR